MKVVEVGFWVAGPSTAGILADWGADVVKIEPPDGDPFRGIMAPLMGSQATINPAFELDNRGKRSISLDFDSDEARAIAARLIDDADVFVSNLRPQALASMGLDYATVSARNPRLVYASVTAYGLEGADANRPAYDVGAFWARTGIAAALTPPGEPLVWQRGGMGDHMVAVAAAGGISAALLSRERTGQGQQISSSLLRVGTFMIGWDVNFHLRLGIPAAPMTRDKPLNPLVNSYQCQDEKWIWLLCLQADRHWPDVVRAIEQPSLLDDERFSTITARMENRIELTKLLDETFSQRPFEEWAEVLDREDVWWAPVQTTADLLVDPQADAAGVFVDVPVDGGSARMVATPVDFSDSPLSPGRMAPELGQHTEEILLELGFEWDQIGELAGRGVIP